MKNPIWIIVFFFIPAGCKSSAPIADVKIPEDLIIRLETNGGMIPDYTQIRLSKDKSIFTEQVRGKTREVYFNSSKPELDKLYLFAEEHHFFQMKSENRGQVYDRGGTIIEIGSAKDPYRVSDNGSDFLLPAFVNNFKLIQQEIRQFANSKIEP